MRILAIETATASSSVALGRGREVVATTRRVDRRGHVGFLVPALEFCFSQAGWRPADIDVIAVDVGPGLFSGIRAGLATAQALAGAIGAPILPVTSTDVVALRAATTHRRIWPVVDVRRGEVAVAPYQPVPGGVVREGPVELVTPDQFRAMVESDRRDGLVVGDWPVFGEGLFRGVHGIRTARPRYPSAEAVLDVAEGRAGRDEFPHPDELRPLYLREPDVAINWSDFRSEGRWGQ
ncbi:MAG TPA: tRNA (adenosine(37)-N6)-threonylcarbamoyltransferase complex dimerization subunit type 1 TsaB [Gemmatimonadales bacterium]|nr:tRNA (adenosine(37)-N6)-threonylcarbamoyltransferase complex dimerization subunit type 1 TsaB [Gemmatimonadales bacterium]